MVNVSKELNGDPRGEMEDVAIARRVGKLPSVEVAMNFCVESMPSNSTDGVHQVWTNLDWGEASALLKPNFMGERDAAC